MSSISRTGQDGISLPLYPASINQTKNNRQTEEVLPIFSRELSPCDGWLTVAQAEADADFGSDALLPGMSHDVSSPSASNEQILDKKACIAVFDNRLVIDNLGKGEQCFSRALSSNILVADSQEDTSSESENASVAKRSVSNRQNKKRLHSQKVLPAGILVADSQESTSSESESAPVAKRLAMHLEEEKGLPISKVLPDGVLVADSQESVTSYQITKLA